MEGHCDERGSNEYNIALGERRARSVYDYLKSLGVDPSRMETISYGEERLFRRCGEDGPESCHKMNRRAEFKWK
ncbi:MAG: OmpA family protein [Bradymonadaceae bacterium]